MYQVTVITKVCEHTMVSGRYFKIHFLVYIIRNVLILYPIIQVWWLLEICRVLTSVAKLIALLFCVYMELTTQYIWLTYLIHTWWFNQQHVDTGSSSDSAPNSQEIIDSSHAYAYLRRLCDNLNIGIEVEIKLPSSFRRHFEMHFPIGNCINLPMCSLPSY